jgi:hypothetical protein
MIEPGLTTLTLAVVSAMVVNALAWIVVVPNPTLVTGTLTLDALPGMTTVAGTVATAGLLELRLTAKPTGGASAERFNVRFCTAIPAIVRPAGKKLMVAVTCTVVPDEP